MRDGFIIPSPPVLVLNTRTCIFSPISDCKLGLGEDVCSRHEMKGHLSHRGRESQPRILERPGRVGERAQEPPNSSYRESSPLPECKQFGATRRLFGRRYSHVPDAYYDHTFPLDDFIRSNELLTVGAPQYSGGGSVRCDHTSGRDDGAQKPVGRLHYHMPIQIGSNLKPVALLSDCSALGAAIPK